MSESLISGPDGTVLLSHTSQLDSLINLARKNSLYYLLFGLACCGIELMHGDGAPVGHQERDQ